MSYFIDYQKRKLVDGNQLFILYNKINRLS